MKAAYIVLPALAMVLMLAPDASAQARRGRTLIQMMDQLYGDFFKSQEVPKAATSSNTDDRIFNVVMSGPLMEALHADTSRIGGGTEQRAMRNAMKIAYLILYMLIMIAVSSIFLWLGSTIAGFREKDGFRKALVCSFFDRVTISALAVIIASMLGKFLTNSDLRSATTGGIVIPAVLVVFFFFISTMIVKFAYNSSWSKAFLIQICTRIAALLVAIFILGFASALSIAVT